MEIVKIETRDGNFKIGNLVVHLAENQSGHDTVKITTAKLENSVGEKDHLKSQTPEPKFLQLFRSISNLVSPSGPYFKWLCFLLYNVYLGFAIHLQLTTKVDSCESNDCWEWCNGVGFVIVVTSLVYFSFVYSEISKNLKKIIPRRIKVKLMKNKFRIIRFTERHLVAKVGIYLTVVSAMVAFFVWDTWTDRRRLMSAAGLALILVFGVLCSKYPRRINWRQVLWGVVLQLIFGLLILRWDLGKSSLDCISKKMDRFLAFSNDGSGFVFGHLSHQKPFITKRLLHNELAYNVTTEINNSKAFSAVIGFKSLASVYFICFVVNILFYFGAVQWMTAKMGRILSSTISTTPCESMNAAANIFLGQAVAPLLIKPYIEKLTKSEIHAVITSGFSTIAGTVMAAFIAMGVSPAHLLSASFMSAPAALACAKLLYPEVEESQLSEEDIRLEGGCGDSSNILDAATRGAVEGATIVLHIAAIVIAFVAMIGFLNSIVSFFGGLVGHGEVTFEWILGKLFIPVVYMMGVDWEECETVATLVGIKVIVNEFMAYSRLSVMMLEGSLSPRAVTITTYALCGFANPASIGITLAALGGICPARRQDYSDLLIRAFIAGTMASLMTACIAGALIADESVII